MKYVVIGLISVALSYLIFRWSTTPVEAQDVQEIEAPEASPREVIP